MSRRVLARILLCSLGLSAAAALAADNAASTADGGSCHSPSTPEAAPPDSAVDVPDYTASDDGDSARDSAEEAALTAWSDYVASVSETLGRSSDPRDWAFAAIANPWSSGVNSAQNAGAGALLARAAKAAPDDVLVQWIAAHADERHGDAIASAATARLEHLEPENAAVFLRDLDAASHKKDDAAIDKTLASMATASRFDLHYAEQLKGLTAAFARQPVPADVAFAAMNENTPPEILPFIFAIGAVSASGLDGFPQLIDACRVRDTHAATRANDCAAIGHLMVHGDTLLANRMGYVVLRVSHTYTPDDERDARHDDWAFANYMKLGHNPLSAAQALAYQNVWFESGNELTALHRMLDVSGVAPEPAADWDDERALFSSDALARDAAWFDQHPAVK